MTEREDLGVLLRELEVIVSNYHDSPAAHRREGDAALYARWMATRKRLFEALADITAENKSLREQLNAASEWAYFGRAAHPEERTPE